MSINIRLLRTLDEYHAAERLQAEVWGIADGIEIVPLHLLLTAQLHGGLVLGAFDDAPAAGGRERLVGFVFGFPGIAPGGKVKHCSHMAATAREYRDRNIGYRLKLGQREHVLAQGIDLVVWTYDPLETRNAYLNLHKLGACCRKYYRDFYGPMNEAQNAGLPSDRLQVEWHITDDRVVTALNGERPALSAAGLRAEGVPVLAGPGAAPIPFPQAARCRLEVPADVQALKAADLAAAGRWRDYLRTAFETAFAAGYIATDLLVEDDRRYYLLERDQTGPQAD